MTKSIEQVMPNGIIRSVLFRAAYNLPKYSRHNMEIVFRAQRGKVGIDWYFSTGWDLEEVREEDTKKRDIGLLLALRPDGLGSIDYHSPVQLHEFQSPIKECEVTGGDCYCDRSSPASRSLFNKFVAKPECVWTELESWLTDTEKRIAAELKQRAGMGD